jgi:hypothetical protein
MSEYLDAKRQDDLLRSHNREPAPKARRDDASFIAQKEKSNGRNEQPSVALRKNAVDEPSEDEGSQKSKGAAEGECNETRDVQGPDGTKRGRKPAEFDGNEIRKRAKGNGIAPLPPKGMDIRVGKVPPRTIEKGTIVRVSAPAIEEYGENLGKKCLGALKECAKNGHRTDGSAP